MEERLEYLTQRESALCRQQEKVDFEKEWISKRQNELVLKQVNLDILQRRLDERERVMEEREQTLNKDRENLKCLESKLQDIEATLQLRNRALQEKEEENRKGRFDNFEAAELMKRKETSCKEREQKIVLMQESIRSDIKLIEKQRKMMSGEIL